MVSAYQNHRCSCCYLRDEGNSGSCDVAVALQAGVSITCQAECRQCHRHLWKKGETVEMQNVLECKDSHSIRSLYHLRLGVSIVSFHGGDPNSTRRLSLNLEVGRMTMH